MRQIYIPRYPIWFRHGGGTQNKQFVRRPNASGPQIPQHDPAVRQIFGRRQDRDCVFGI